MATIWTIVANWLIPVPLLLFLLTSLPLPRGVRRGTLIFTQRVFDVPILGGFKLLHVMLWLTAVAFLNSVRQVHVFHQQRDSTVPFATPNMEISFLSKRWRAERNLWISAFAFTAWAFLAAFYREAVRRLDLEARLADMVERSEVTHERDTSVGPREVTSKAAAVAAAAAHRTPMSSPNKTAAQPAGADPVGSLPDRSGGIQMQELKKDM